MPVPLWAQVSTMGTPSALGELSLVDGVPLSLGTIGHIEDSNDGQAKVYDL